MPQEYDISMDGKLHEANTLSEEDLWATETVSQLQHCHPVPS